MDAESPGRVADSSGVRAGLRRATLGSTGLQVTAIACGTGSWRTVAPPNRRNSESVDTAGVAARILSGEGVGVIDTSNNYGFGDSETRIGSAIAEHGLPEGVLVQTKVDRDYQSGSFSGERMRASLRESMDRLGLDHLPLVFLHDPENTTLADLVGPDGAIRALLEARDAGLIGHLGVAGGTTGLLRALLALGHFDALVTHNRYSLVDRSADRLLDEAAERGVGVYNAAPYGGGMLTAYPPPRTIYAYREAPEELVRAATEIGRICHEAGVPPVAAALQWSMREPRITSTIVGMLRLANHDETLAAADVVFPPGLWEAIEAVRLDEASFVDAPEER